MAKKSSIEKNNRRRRMAQEIRRPPRAAEGDRARQAMPVEERFAARSSSPKCRATRPRRASATAARSPGRPRGYYRKHKMSRIALRELGSKGLIPGLVKSSW